MRLRFKASALASVVAVTALSIQGLSPTMAAEPDSPDEPTAGAPATPAEPEATSPETTGGTPAETGDVDGPPAGDTEGLVDVTIGEKTAPLQLPLDVLSLPLDILRYNVSKSGEQSAPGDRYDGSAVGLYIDAHVGDLLKLTSRKVAAVYMPKDESGGSDQRESARFALPEFFFAPTVEAYGIESYAKSEELYFSYDRPAAEASTRVARFVASSLVAEGIEVTARAQQSYEDDTFSATAQMHVARLKIGTKEYNAVDIPPNKTYNIAGLGKVVLNEQKITEVPGDRYAAKVNAIHITLSTASLGLPVGTDIYVGSAEAILHE
jgi:hypothetical protein